MFGIKTRERLQRAEDQISRLQEAMDRIYLLGKDWQERIAILEMKWDHEKDIHVDAIKQLRKDLSAFEAEYRMYKGVKSEFIDRLRERLDKHMLAAEDFMVKVTDRFNKVDEVLEGKEDKK